MSCEGNICLRSIVAPSFTFVENRQSLHLIRLILGSIFRSFVIFYPLSLYAKQLQGTKKKSFLYAFYVTSYLQKTSQSLQMFWSLLQSCVSYSPTFQRQLFGGVQKKTQVLFNIINKNTCVSNSKLFARTVCSALWHLLFPIPKENFLDFAIRLQLGCQRQIVELFVPHSSAQRLYQGNCVSPSTVFHTSGT